MKLFPSPADAFFGLFNQDALSCQFCADRIRVGEFLGGAGCLHLFDLLIQNANIVEGSGKPGFLGSLGVTDGQISEVGPIPAEAQAVSTLDAQGLTLSPGFIDIHTHADIALLARPDHLPKVMQGVTTEVFTNCGLGFAPVTEEGLRIQLGGLSK